MVLLRVSDESQMSYIKVSMQSSSVTTSCVTTVEKDGSTTRRCESFEKKYPHRIHVESCNTKEYPEVGDKVVTYKQFFQLLNWGTQYGHKSVASVVPMEK